MFSLFGKKEAATKVIDKIWMTEDAKFRALLEEWKKNNGIVIICWFDETLRRLNGFFARQTDKPAPILMAREPGSAPLHDKTILFAEHYPLSEKETELFLRLNLAGVTVYSSLDEALFNRFGGGKISVMMKRLGMQESECIENSMIGNALKNAQQKIAKKVVYEQSAGSQSDWFARNLPA